MSGQADVVAVIEGAGTALGSNVYADKYIGVPPKPYAIVSCPYGIPNRNFHSSNKIRYLYQVDIFAETREQAINIAAPIIVAMERAAFKASTLQLRPAFEEVVELYRVSLDFGVWQ